MADIGTEEKRRTLVINERAKLLANSLDRLSTACIAAGFIAPVSSLSSANGFSGISLSVVASTAAWIFGAMILHLAARRALGELKI